MGDCDDGGQRRGVVVDHHGAGLGVEPLATVLRRTRRQAFRRDGESDDVASGTAVVRRSAP